MKRFAVGSAIAVLCVWVLLPIWLVATAAFGGAATINAWPKSLLPEGASLWNVGRFFQIAGVGQALLTSIETAAICLVLALSLGVPAGYALARWSFRGQVAYRLLVLLTRAFPVAILALPLTVGFIRIGIYDTAFGVALVHTALAMPFAVLVSAALFQGIPRELEEAAYVFGCSRIGAFRRVALPLAAPGLAAIAIFAFVISWNEVFAASVLGVRHRTLTAFLLALLSESPLSVQFAGGFLLIVPSVAFIFAVRRQLFAMWGISSR